MSQSKISSLIIILSILLSINNMVFPQNFLQTQNLSSPTEKILPEIFSQSPFKKYSETEINKLQKALLDLKTKGTSQKRKKEALQSVHSFIRQSGLSSDHLTLFIKEQIKKEWILEYSKKINNWDDWEEIKALILTFSTKNVRSLSKIPPKIIKGKTFLVRVDYNDTHFDLNAPRIDDIRMNMSFETLNFIRKHGGKIILVMHFGRPHGTGSEENFSITEIYKAINKLLKDQWSGFEGINFYMGEMEHDKYTIIPENVKSKIKQMKIGEVILLDNIRFMEEETSKDEGIRLTLAKDLATIADYYILDGFPISHRSNASVIEMSKVMPTLAGFWMEKEMEINEEFLSYLKSPNRGPVAAIFGGKKEDKLNLIKDFCTARLRKGDKLLIGGKLASFLQQEAHFEKINYFEKMGIQLILAEDYSDTSQLDIGPETETKFINALKEVSGVYWNGPMGKFEQTPYQNGSYSLAKYLHFERNEGKLQRVFVSGGETAFVVKSALNLTELDRKNKTLIEIDTGGGTSTDLFAYEQNIGMDNIWGVNKLILAENELPSFLFKSLDWKNIGFKNSNVFATKSKKPFYIRLDHKEDDIILNYNMNENYFLFSFYDENKFLMSSLNFKNGKIQFHLSFDPYRIDAELAEDEITQGIKLDTKHEFSYSDLVDFQITGTDTAFEIFIEFDRLPRKIRRILEKINFSLLTKNGNKLTFKERTTPPLHLQENPYFLFASNENLFTEKKSERNPAPPLIFNESKMKKAIKVYQEEIKSVEQEYSQSGNYEARNANYYAAYYKLIKALTNLLNTEESTYIYPVSGPDIAFQSFAPTYLLNIDSTDMLKGRFKLQEAGIISRSNNALTDKQILENVLSGYNTFDAYDIESFYDIKREKGIKFHLILKGFMFIANHYLKSDKEKRAFLIKLLDYFLQVGDTVILLTEHDQEIFESIPSIEKHFKLVFKENQMLEKSQMISFEGFPIITMLIPNKIAIYEKTKGYTPDKNIQLIPPTALKSA